MKLKVTLSPEYHNGPATCVAWNSIDEVYSCSDDNRLLKWNVTNNESQEVSQLPKDISSTDLQPMPRNALSNKQLDVMLLTGTDGRFHFLNRSGKIERSTEAHTGAILVGRWSPDGVGFLTAGEDGLVKVWSKSGMLRSTVVSSSLPVYSAAWSPDSKNILYTEDNHIVIKNLKPNTKPVKWRAHERLILCVSWSANANSIITGSEDCRYKVWDTIGKLLYASPPHDFPITALSWSPQGDMFAIGSYNTLRLCDFAGWSHCLEKFDSGSLYHIAWSNDGTQLAAPCANGHMIFAHLIDRHYKWQNFTVTVVGKKSITVNDVLNEMEEQLDFSENVMKVALGFGYLIVTTNIQCHVYLTTNWNTPTIFDLKEGVIFHILLCERYFAMVDLTSVTVYTYQGRALTSLRWPSMNPETISRSLITISPDTLCICDQTDFKTIHIFDLSTNRALQDSANTIQHSIPIKSIALSQAGDLIDRQITIIDQNKELFLVYVRGTNKTFSKIAGQILSLEWNTDCNMIAVIQDVRLIVWYCPNAAMFNEQLLKLASLRDESAELGRGPRVVGYSGNMVSVRRDDGSLFNVGVSPFPMVLHEHIAYNRWTEAVNLCRLINDATLWACLAVFATLAKLDGLDTAEEAYAAINQIDKVAYIQHIRNLPTKSQQMAGVALLCGSTQEAETILVHNGLIFEAIQANVHTHNWNKALEIAIKHKTHVDTVLYWRQKYLKNIKKKEKNATFLQLQDTISVDENKIIEKIQMEAMKTH